MRGHVDAEGAGNRSWRIRQFFRNSLANVAMRSSLLQRLLSGNRKGTGRQLAAALAMGAVGQDHIH